MFGAGSLNCSFCKSFRLKKAEKINVYATKYVCESCGNNLIYNSRPKPENFESKKDSQRFMGRIYEACGMPRLQKRVDDDAELKKRKMLIVR